ncbi:transcription factor LHW-like isoform X1 [Typha angustifolia]|uniref:transcription factor LHW-like isoform X1 n=2 Tax=Typha angustifolia TaxID=59011 RepID=UPI003C304BA4
MGSPLREALSQLCIEIGWSYGVFWKAIRSGNRVQLVWGDGHCERMSADPVISGFEAMDLLLKEKIALRGSREGHVGELGCRAEDRVTTLVNNLMVPQVHVVGDGIIGRAALMGNHQWILHDHESVTKELAEMNQQFWAGIQTIAIIPVLPHGVVQLGSTKMVMEDIRFINHVKCLFEQLCCEVGVPFRGTVLRDLSQKVSVQDSLGVPNIVSQTRNMITEINRSMSLTSDGCNKHLESPNSSPASQLSCLAVTQSYGRIALDVPLIQQTSSSSPILLSGFVQQMTHPHHRPNFLNNELEGEHLRSQIRICNPEMSSTIGDLPHDSSSIPTSDLCHSRSMLVKKHLLPLSGNGKQDSAKHNGFILDDTTTVQLGSDGHRFPSSLKDSNVLSLLDRSKLTTNANDFGGCRSHPGNKMEILNNQCTVSNSASMPHTLNRIDGSINSNAISVDYFPNNATSVNKKFQTMSIAENLKQDNDLFQALGVPLTEPDQQSLFFQSLRGALQTSCSNNTNTIQQNSSHHAVVAETGNSAGNKSSTEVSDSYGLLHVDEWKLPVTSEAVAENDLFDALALQGKSRSCDGRFDDAFVHSSKVNAIELSTDIFTCITQQDIGQLIGALYEDISFSGLISESKPDQLLDAIVSKQTSAGKQNLFDNISCDASSTRTSSSLDNANLPAYVWEPSSKQMVGRSLAASPITIKRETPASSSVKSVCSEDKTEGCSQKYAGKRSEISLWVENCQSVASDSISAGHSKRADEVGKLNRKRSRPGENPRPRPKDRQMIQDRVKELRGIVPNGAKCSIDALLEKTIKHMLFLQSVTKHADKLKEAGEPKIISKEGNLLLKDNFEGGATWAFDVGTQSMACPIIVEDLNSPRQMLVEMLCEERGLFLEIADQIRGLGLTILKGVMEVRKDKVWARFVVEANRDVTRMEIFLSLVHLLEPTLGNSMLPKVVGLSSNTFHPSSIPATGYSDCLR